MCSMALIFAWQRAGLHKSQDSARAPDYRPGCTRRTGSLQSVRGQGRTDGRPADDHSRTVAACNGRPPAHASSPLTAGCRRLAVRRARPGGPPSAPAPTAASWISPANGPLALTSQPGSKKTSGRLAHQPAAPFTPRPI